MSSTKQSPHPESGEPRSRVEQSAHVSTVVAFGRTAKMLKPRAAMPPDDHPPRAA